MDVYNKLIIVGPPTNIKSIRDMLGAPAHSAYKVNKPSRGHEVLYSSHPAPSFMLANIVIPAFNLFSADITWARVATWNMVNWGVEEEVTSASLVSETLNHLVYRFCTHKNAPFVALESLSYLYSPTTLYIETSHKDGAGARGVYKDGEYTSTGDWKAPDSHRAFERIRGEGTCTCQHTIWTQVYPPFFDCLRSPVPTDRAVEEMNKVSIDIDVMRHNGVY
jgi:hypothetical protein